MSLKNCPFCGGVAEIEEWQGGSSRTNYLVECANAGGDCPMAVCSGSYDNRDEAITAWNTRAAPTMKPWVWDESNSHGQAWKCEAFKALVNKDDYGTCWASVGNDDLVDLGRHKTPELAKAACVAYVDGKLKEWLV